MSQDRNIGCFSFVMLMLIGMIVMSSTASNLGRIARALESIDKKLEAK